MKPKTTLCAAIALAIMLCCSTAAAQSPVTPTLLFGPTNATGTTAFVPAPPNASGSLPGSLVIEVFISGTANITLSGKIDNLPTTTLPILSVSGQSISAITSSGDYWVPAVQSLQANINSISGLAQASMVASAAPFVTLSAVANTLTVIKSSSSTVMPNAAGSGSAPITVTAGAAVKVISGLATRKSYTILPESSDLRCMPGTVADNANATTPTATIGFLLRANTYFKEDVAPGNRLDCISTTATTSVDSWEEN